MKKTLFFGALAAMLLGTACSNEIDQPAMGDEVSAAFSVSMDGIESRAISDGLTVNELYFEVYEAKTEGETTTYTKLPSLSQKVAVSSRTATVTTKLVKGKTYKFAFWAQKDGAYVATDLQNIAMNYANANDESRDAFFANLEKTVEGAFEENVTLYRPFAQINFGASDIDAAMNITGFTSQLVVTGVPNQFNVLSGEASGEANVTLAATAVPALVPEVLTVDGTNYTYISMNYILATPEKATKDIELKVMDGTTEVKTLPVASCPMQRNYRTNILGDLISVEGKFNITVDPIYNGDHNIDMNAKYYDVTEDGGLEDVMAVINTEKPEKAIVRIAAGKTVTWKTGAEHGSTPLVPVENEVTKEVVFEGGDGSTFKAIGAGVGPIRAANGTTKLVFKNLNIVDESVSYAESAWEHGYLEFSGKLKFENCVIKDGISLDGKTNNNSTDLDAEIVNCKFISNETSGSWLPSPASTYLVWISGGKASFTNCDFTGFRGPKIHEAYGSDVDAVYFDGCNFHDLSKKPGIAIGTVNASTTISIKNSQFVNCQPGDQDLYMYESDTNVSTFNFINENNTVQND